MVIYSIDYWDDWLDRITRLTHIESWWYPPAYCKFHTNSKYGDGKQWWMTLGSEGHWYWDENNTYGMRNEYLDVRLAMEVKEFVFMNTTHLRRERSEAK